MRWLWRRAGASPTSSSWAWASRWPTSPRSSRRSGSSPTPGSVSGTPRGASRSRRCLVSGIGRLGSENLKVNLAISLHAASDEVRSRLMPVNQSWNLGTLMEAVRRDPLAPRQRVFFEYVLLEGVNDSPEDARQLARLLRGVRAKVNLIPFNDWEGAPFRRPALATILAFQSTLLDAGITTTVRWSKGEDIGAACGQLREPMPEASAT